MTDASEQRPELEADDRAFVDGVRRHYRAPTLKPARRQAFDASLASRLARLPWWRPAPWALGAGVAGGLALFIFFGALAPPPSVDRASEVANGPPVLASQTQALTPEEVILALSRGDLAEGDDPDGLDFRDADIPDDYRAIDALFLEGV